MHRCLQRLDAARHRLRGRRKWHRRHGFQPNPKRNRSAACGLPACQFFHDNTGNYWFDVKRTESNGTLTTLSSNNPLPQTTTPVTKAFVGNVTLVQGLTYVFMASSSWTYASSTQGYLTSIVIDCNYPAPPAPPSPSPSPSPRPPNPSPPLPPPPCCGSCSVKLTGLGYRYGGRGNAHQASRTAHRARHACKREITCDHDQEACRPALRRLGGVACDCKYFQLCHECSDRQMHARWQLPTACTLS